MQSSTVWKASGESVLSLTDASLISVASGVVSGPITMEFLSSPKFPSASVTDPSPSESYTGFKINPVAPPLPSRRLLLVPPTGDVKQVSSVELHV